MSFMMVEKEFKLVGLKGSGEFVNYGDEVPLLAKQLLSRSRKSKIQQRPKLPYLSLKRMRIIG